MIPDSKLDEAERKTLQFIKDFPTVSSATIDISFVIELIEELKWRRSGDQHTCHAECRNPMCVMRRELDWSKKMLARAKELAEDSIEDGPYLRARQFIEDLEAGPGKDKP
jgi:hypothetical protein